MSYPRITWLSPLNHKDTFFHLTDPETAGLQGSKWLVPQDVVANTQLEVSPERMEGCAVIGYDLPDVSLSRFAIEPVR